MTALAAEIAGGTAEQYLVASTGVIGHFLPMDAIAKGIGAAGEQLGSDSESLENAASAMLTTDTRIKVRSRTAPIDGQEITCTGIAKGAAMIGPNMATLLAFVMTDAPVIQGDLTKITKSASDRSFNSISVEGHTSTNDTLIVLANGTGEQLSFAGLEKYEQMVTEVCIDLARDIVGDAEGCSHTVEIRVTGLESEADARCIAKAVAESALVKTAIFGGDPNWGRFVSRRWLCRRCVRGKGPIALARRLFAVRKWPAGRLR